MTNLTAEQLIVIADDIAAEFEPAFLPPCIAAARKMLQAAKHSVDQGMPKELTVAALMRFSEKLDGTMAKLEAELDAIVKEIGA